ncbi:ribonuclease H-like domain-containing protein [Tanacetum coccineum]
MVTRSQPSIIKPIDLSLHTLSISPILKSPFLALNDLNWSNVMYDEYNALVKMARLFANGSSQQLSVDFDGPVVKSATIRMVLSLAVSRQDLYMNKYALQLLERAHMVHCNPSRTPVDTETKLGPDDVPVQDPTLYRSLAWRLQYLTFTRLDLSYAVQHICLYMHDTREPHFAALKRIMRYVKGTLDFGLHLYASTTTSLVGYTNAN